jgi:putative SOS response-associated peptidase YedK
MPVILAGKDYERWLDHEEPERLPVDLLRPFQAEHMRMWKVSWNVNYTKNNRPDLIDPIP